MTSGSSCSSSRGVHPISDPIMAFVAREVQSPTQQPRQSCQGSQRLGYHLFGSSTGTTCWLVCGSASKWKRFMCFHRAKKRWSSPNFHAWVLWKSSFLTVFQYSRFAKNTLGWWFFLASQTRFHWDFEICLELFATLQGTVPDPMIFRLSLLVGYGLVSCRVSKFQA